MSWALQTGSSDGLSYSICSWFMVLKTPVSCSSIDKTSHKRKHQTYFCFIKCLVIYYFWHLLFIYFFSLKKEIHSHFTKNNIFAVCLSFNLIFFFNWRLLKYLMKCLHFGLCDSKFLASSDTVYRALPDNL